MGRKHTDMCLSFTSHHPVQVKKSTVITLMKQARDVISNQHPLKNEMKHQQGVMLNNNYPIGFLRRCRTLKLKEKAKMNGNHTALPKYCVLKD